MTAPLSGDARLTARELAPARSSPARDPDCVRPRGTLRSAPHPSGGGGGWVGPGASSGSLPGAQKLAFPATSARPAEWLTPRSASCHLGP